VILVVGGTGHLGRRVVDRLIDSGQAVRVMARRAEDAQDLDAAGVELFAGDVRNPRACTAAATGASVVISAVQGFAGPGKQSPEEVDRDGNRALTDAAMAAGADLVLLSVVGASPDHPMSLQRMKWAAEEYLRRSGVPWTIIRGTPFAETWADVLRESGGGGGRVRVFGRGENPITFVSIEDVAAAVLRAVVDPALRGQVIEIGGPASLTLNQLARMVSPGSSPRHVPRTLLRVMAVAARPVQPQLARLARAAVVMDTADLTFDAAASHAAYPWLTSTPVTAERLGA
jgi:NADH dehydrogenase